MGSYRLSVIKTSAFFTKFYFLSMTALSLLITTQAIAQPAANNVINQINKPLYSSDLSAFAWGNSEASSLVSAAQVSGSYAVAQLSTGSIEIRDIREKLLHKLSKKHFLQAIGTSSENDKHSLCAMTLTPSARMLFIAVCAQNKSIASSSKTQKDTILAFNLNTKALRVFSKLDISNAQSKNRLLPMTYFKGQLFIGTDNGLFRLSAGRNAVISASADDIENNAIKVYQPAKNSKITGLAVNMVEKRLYLASNTGVFQSSLAKRKLQFKQLSNTENIISLTYGRNFGSEKHHGLLALVKQADSTQLLLLDKKSISDAKNAKPLTFKALTELAINTADISATAEGRLLISGQQTLMLSDSSDPVLNFEQWLVDELNQYVAAIKSLIGSKKFQGTNSIIPEGFLARKLVQQGAKQNLDPIADNVGWALFLLMAADQVTPDADIEPLIELLIQRHAGLHPDGLGGVKTVDGHFVRNYEPEGIPHKKNPQAQVYISMKFLPAVYKAVDLYPNNQNFKAYKEYLRQLQKRASDTISAQQRITWTNDDHGPILSNNRMTNETWLYGDIGAAQDPLATQDYGHYVYQRENMSYDNWLLGEPVIKASHSVFIIMGGTMILKHHFSDPAWREQNHNYYAITKAATDDLGAPYFAGFSAGNNPFSKKSGYYNDGPSDHPGDIIHFPAVLGLGQLGWTSPVVGAYQAYRDGRRQNMLNGATGENISMLTRWSAHKPSYTMNSLGIADFWYGAMGLVETITPGTIARLRNEFYRPKLTTEQLADGKLALHYSKITPRRIMAKKTTGEQVSFGFQLSPFIVEQPEQFTNYQAIDPEGEWLELNKIFTAEKSFTNPNFEQGLNGWSSSNSKLSKQAQVIAVNKEQLGMVSNALVITPSPENTTKNIAVSQALDLRTDLTDTRYLFRANGLLNSKNDGTKSFMKIAWDDDNNANNGILVSQKSQALNDEDTPIEFLIDTLKPENASYVHISFNVFSGTSTSANSASAQYLFDNLSLVRLGAASAVKNGDFELGLNTWKKSSRAVKLISEPKLVLEGKKSLLFALGAGNTSWHSVSRKFNVTNDELGTRYIFKLDAKAFRMLDSDFEIMMESFDKKGKKIIVRNDIGDILPSTNGEITFSFRKRPDDASYRLTLRMKRNSKKSKGTDVIVVDNLRMFKEQLF